jgi:hypothetical protein
MRARFFLATLVLAATSCGGEAADEPVGNPTADELHNRIENVAFVPTEKEAEKAVPRRLGVLQEAALPAEYRDGRSCRLTEGANLLLIAAAPGAVANIDGRVIRMTIAGPVGPSGGFFEAPGRASASASSRLKAQRSALRRPAPASRSAATIPSRSRASRRAGSASADEPYFVDLGFFFGSAATPFSLIAIPAGTGQLPVHEDEEADDEAGTTAAAGFFGPVAIPDSLIAIGLAPCAPCPPQVSTIAFGFAAQAAAAAARQAAAPSPSQSCGTGGSPLAVWPFLSTGMPSSSIAMAGSLSATSV